MELLDLCDKNGNKLGRTVIRDHFKPEEGEYIRLVLVWIKSQNKYLIQKCSKQKGGEYAITGGHITSGNEPKQQVVIECQEELGIKVDESKLEYLGNVYLPHAIFCVFSYSDDTLLDHKFTLQTSEVESIKFYSPQELNDLFQKDNVRQTTIRSYNEFIKNRND